MTIAGNLWEVVGGGGADGILVRAAKDRASPQAASRLATGAVVRALEIDEKAGRLHYELVAGAGPASGWVSTSVKGKDLLVARVPPQQWERCRAQPTEEAVTPRALQWYSQRLQKNRSNEEDEVATPLPLLPAVPATKRQQHQPSALDAPLDLELLMKNALAVFENDRDCVGFKAIARSHRPTEQPKELHQQQAFRASPTRQRATPQAPCLGCPALTEKLAQRARFSARAGRECNVAEESADEEDARPPCPRCQLPLGDWGYLGDGSGATLLHGECMAKLMLDSLREEEEGRLHREAVLKRARREEFGIGWKAELIPRSTALACNLQCSPVPQGTCCLALDPSTRAVHVAPSIDPATSVNLEYLAIALQVRKREGREPLFSLDPKGGLSQGTGALQDLVQVQRFEPAWLAGTSVGEVMFQADYHLKELSMGEQPQPVVGLRSCLDLSEEAGYGNEWRAREWYVVKKAGVSLAAGNVLAPHVQMGVEARQIVEGPDGLEDACITSPDHPLVKYADAFTHYFDLIAERRSAVYHLRELAKASVLAKVLLEDPNLQLQDAWFEATSSGEPAGALEIPQLWNERSHCQIRLKDGKLLGIDEGPSTRRHGVYGGVEFGLDAVVGDFTAAPLFSSAALIEEPGQYVSFAEITKGAVAPARQPRGVDLNLDGFSLSTPAVPVADVEDVLRDKEACCAFGGAFWSSLSSEADSALATGDKKWLRAIFNPKLSDRRAEGDLFVPPDASPEYLHALGGLLREEDHIRQRRKAHFLSGDFEADNAGPLFPSTWAASFGVAREESHLSGVAKDVRAPSAAEAGRLQQALRSAAPFFDKTTEDGARFRAYRLGRLEVRTVQEEEGPEAIGAVCEACAPAEVPKPTDIVTKATEYVEAEDAAGAASPRCHFYVVLETETRNFIVTEKLRDGKVRWAANPKHLEARNSLARVTGCVECSGAGVTVRDIQHSEVRALLSNCDRRRYARGVYGLAQPALRKCWAALTEAQRHAAERLGARGTERWDESAAQVWQMQWWQLSDLQRAAASDLGACADSWDELRQGPQAA